jgi:hypothetical protein
MAWIGCNEETPPESHVGVKRVESISASLNAHTYGRAMIAWIHFALGARVRNSPCVQSVCCEKEDFQNHTCFRLARSVVLHPFSVLLKGVCFLASKCAFAAQDVARFMFILCAVIPSLVCMFVVMGVTIHIPRILCTYCCRIVMRLCWYHVRQPQKQRLVVCSDQKRSCSGTCCLACKLAVWISGGTFQGSGVVSCCTCGHRVVLGGNNEHERVLFDVKETCT